MGGIFHSVRDLLPIFRSDTQAKVVAEVFLDPDAERSLTEVSVRTGVPLASVQREVERLERAGLVRSRRLGATRQIKADRESPYYSDLRSLVVKAFGPVAVLASLLGDVEGVEEAFVFGSWARRLLGEEGQQPGDVDLAVIGTPDPDAVVRACQQAEEQLGRPVNATILTPQEWAAAGSGFLTAVRQSPRVPVPVDGR